MTVAELIAALPKRRRRAVERVRQGEKISRSARKSGIPKSTLYRTLHKISLLATEEWRAGAASRKPTLDRLRIEIDQRLEDIDAIIDVQERAFYRSWFGPELWGLSFYTAAGLAYYLDVSAQLWATIERNESSNALEFIAQDCARGILDFLKHGEGWSA